MGLIAANLELGAPCAINRTCWDGEMG